MDTLEITGTWILPASVPTLVANLRPRHSTKHCWEAGIQLSLATPKKQHQNHLAERTWQTIGGMARSLLVHVRLPDTFMYHALVYACHIFNVLPVKGLYSGDHVTTPLELLQGVKPSISHFRVFGCPVTARKWTTSTTSTGKQTERGIRGIFVGFDANQKGYMFYAPASRQLYISADIQFDEQLSSTIAHTWQLHCDSLALRPVSSDIPLATTTLEHTGAVIRPTVKEGIHKSCDENVPDLANRHTASDDDCNDNVPDLVDDDDNSTAEYDSDSEIEDDKILDLETPTEPEPASISPQPVLASLRRSTRTRKPYPKYANAARGYEWENEIIGSDYQKLARECAIEATPAIPPATDALSWEPAPSSIRDILKMPDGTVRQEWHESVKKELKTLVDSQTFEADNRQDGETSTSVMAIFKDKVKSDGSLDKLKTWLVVRGDLQDKNITEDK